MPADWQVYAALHFSIAYPGDWIVQIAPGTEGETHYEVLSTRGGYSVQVVEEDNIDASLVAAFCSSSGQVVAFAGLPMRYMEGSYGHTLIWQYFTLDHTNYQLQTTDISTNPGVQAEEKSILETFLPDDTTSGCQ